MNEAQIREIVREELAKLLSDPPAALFEALAARIGADWAARAAEIVVTAPPKTPAPAPTPAG